MNQSGQPRTVKITEHIGTINDQVQKLIFID